MDANTSCIKFDPCNFAMNQDLEVSLSDSGKLLTISICLRNVCPDKDLIVGVLIYYNGKPYALETKEINTADFCQCSCCCCCCRGLEDICIDGFEFIFPPNICQQKVAVKAIVHYII